MLIPIDIIETIIEILVHDEPDLSSTKTCSLVNRDFLHVARKHIFGWIVLNEVPNMLLPLWARGRAPASRGGWNKKMMTLMLVHLLSMAPAIGAYIRDLMYVITVGDVDRSSLLVPAFQRLCGLTTLTIWDPGYTVKPFGWADGPLREGLLHLLRIPTLVRLRIMGIGDFVLGDLVHCVNLECFEFRDVGIAEIEDSPPLDSGSDLPIRLHRIKGESRIAEVLGGLCALRRPDGGAAIDFGNMASISVVINGQDDVRACEKLFRRCDQLVEVNYSVYANALTFQGFSRMVQPSLRTLKHLSLSVKTSSNDPVVGLASELEEMRSHNIIETIAIKVMITKHPNAPPGDEWDMLDKTLARPGWPKLQQVSLTILILKSLYMGRGSEGEWEGAWMSLRETRFPHFMFGGHFSVEFVDEDKFERD